MTDNELDALLGRAEADASLGASRLSESELVQLGKEYFNNLLPQMRAHVCDNATLKMLLSQQNQERNTLIIAIGVALSGVSSVPLALAERLLRYGYKQLCN